MAVLIGHASISEKGTINGTPGDQTGREVFTRSWYAKPWNVMLICTDKELAKRAAQEMRYACANDKIGYGQNDRTTAYSSAKANGGSFRYSKKGNTDCSQLIAGCYIFAGLTNLSPHCYTGNLRAALLATGKFKAYTDAAHLNSDAYAEVGAVYLKEGSHVVMALENGSKGGNADSKPPAISGDTHTVKKGDTLSAIAKAWGVSTAEIAAYNGISNPNVINIGQVIKNPSKQQETSNTGDKIVEDGQWGEVTTRRLQHIFGTSTDGIISNQLVAYKSQNPGLVAGFEWESIKFGGSALIEAIQNKIGVSSDGYLGPNTIKAIQRWLGCGVDGYFSNPSACIKALQHWANQQ